MKRSLFAALAAVLVLVSLAGGRADAQVGSWGTFGQPPVDPFGGSTISPWLNLGRGGNLGINYFALVRPQQQAQQGFQQLQVQQQQLFQQQAATANALAQQTSPLVTGHQSSFANFSYYYPPTVMGVGTRR